MKKRLLAVLFTGAFVVSTLAACGNDSGANSSSGGGTEQQESGSNTGSGTDEGGDTQNSTPADSEEEIVLTFGTGNSETVDVYQEIFDNYHAEHPNVTVEVSVLPSSSADFYSALSAKMTAGDAPDIFTYWWDTNINNFARNGLILDITDTGIRDTMREIKKPYNQYEGRDYAYPTQFSMWGLIYNTELGEAAGVTETPKTFDEFLDDMQKIRDSGIEYPFIIPAKDGSGATGPVFCYLHQIVSGDNPDFYYQILLGEKSWDGPEWRGLLDTYAQIIEYANPDSLGLDPDNALTRFARGEGAFLVQSPSTVKTLQEMNPDLAGKLKYIPFPLYDNEEDYETIADFDNAVSIWSGTKYPEAAKDVLKYFFSVENNAKQAESRNAIPVINGADTSFVDFSLQDQLPLLEEGKYVGFSEREWVPGIKDIMKAQVQEWMGGESVDTVLSNLQKEHTRLVEADPDFITEFEQLRSSMGLD